MGKYIFFCLCQVIALEYVLSIMAVTGAIFPKIYANAITENEQKKKMLSHATSVGNKQKQTEDKKYFFVSNIVYIVSSLSKKSDAG